MDTSFPIDRWPATKVVGPDGSARFVLKDGTEIHRTEPPPDVYDYHTGKLIGWLGAKVPSLLPALAPFTVEAAVVSAKKDDEVENLDL